MVEEIKRIFMTYLEEVKRDIMECPKYGCISNI